MIGIDNELKIYLCCSDCGTKIPVESGCWPQLEKANKCPNCGGELKLVERPGVITK